jgi:ureidoacrylate peracid hydrolase
MMADNMHKIIERKGRVLELTERVDLTHTALIVIDIQNDFCHKDGIFGKLGYDMSWMDPAIESLRELISEARRHEILTIFVRGNEDGKYLSVPMAETYNRRDFKSGLACKGTWGAEWYLDIKPTDAPNEVNFIKYRFGAFESTSLDLYLRSNGIKTLITGGVVTSGCVESTIRNAFSQGYYVVVPSDCVADASEARHNASIHKFGQAFGEVVTSKQIVEAWKKSKPALRHWHRDWKARRILSDLHAQVAPEHTALVLIDLQRDYCSKGGALAQSGEDVSRIQAALPAIEKLLTAARSSRVMVVHLGTTHGNLTNSDVAMEGARSGVAACCEPNTPGAEFLSEVAPLPEEEIVFKHRSGGFGDTHLELLLRSSAIRTLVIAGFGVAVGIESTVREASDKDYYIVMAEDCVASAGHDPCFDAVSTRIMGQYFARIVPLDELVAAWQGQASVEGHTAPVK